MPFSTAWLRPGELVRGGRGAPQGLSSWWRDRGSASTPPPRKVNYAAAAAMKAIGCSNLRGGGSELGTIKILTYASN